LESTLDWYVPMVERQIGLKLHYEKTGTPFAVDGNTGVQVYRVLQEALNNVKRHAAAQEAWVRLRFLEDELRLEVEDHGKGFSPQANHQGIGLVGMRERAELVGGSLQVSQRNGGGTLVQLTVPAAKAEAHDG
jgi:signal transduction histidine kinase